ncbi:MAG TPA: hypothetical protein VFS99_02210 [Xanthomonadaceae bacterium]|nr:hypothetical protein [Xanthomonadaceae bacterium]
MGPIRQRGVSTLAVTLILLVIITAMVLFSTSVGYFEQRTTTNQNRARMAEQSAEYALSLAGEYLKANRDRLISDQVADGGWFATGTEHWVPCMATPPAGHPCLSERDLARRADLYYWTSDGTATGSLELPYTAVVPAGAQVEDGVGGAADFAADTTVGALLCRLDTTDPNDVHCELDPASGNRIALTLVAQVALAGEGADAQVREAWATYNSFVPSAAVPLVASGWVQGLGNAQIVAAPNAGGYGLPASIWTPNDADITTNGSFVTCHVGDFLKGTSEAALKTTCATTDDCTCGGGSSSQFLSGHMGGGGAGSITREAEDIIDKDAGVGALPDIQFFPGGGMDKAADPTDDSLFEYTFNVGYTTAEADAAGTTLANCGETALENCVQYAMLEEFQAEEITQAQCLTLDANSSGILYAGAGCTALPSGTAGSPAVIGSPGNPVILVLNQTDAGQLSLGTAGGNLVFYGLLFVHDDTPNTTSGATELVTGQGGVKLFGALVVEGNVKMSGDLTIIYDDTSTSGDTHKLPSSAKFGRVAGSWLDSSTAF